MVARLEKLIRAASLKFPSLMAFTTCIFPRLHEYSGPTPGAGTPTAESIHFCYQASDSTRNFYVYAISYAFYDVCSDFLFQNSLKLT